MRFSHEGSHSFIVPYKIESIGAIVGGFGERIDLSEIETANEGSSSEVFVAEELGMGEDAIAFLYRWIFTIHFLIKEAALLKRKPALTRSFGFLS